MGRVAIAFALLAAGCSITIPDGRFGCPSGEDSECPPNQTCDVDLVCRGVPSGGVDLGVDPDLGVLEDQGPAPDAGVDQGSAPPVVGVVFDDDFGPGVVFVGFDGARNVVASTDAEAFEGALSLAIEVPDSGFTGGSMVFVDGQTGDATMFNAVRFYAKASALHTLDVAGIGNDPGVSVAFNSELGGDRVVLTEEWRRFTIPIPNPGKAGAVRGLFHFAEGGDEGAYTIFLDAIEYVEIDGLFLSNSRIEERTIVRETGMTFEIMGTESGWGLDDGSIFLAPTGRAWFDFTSSDPAVATVEDGVVTARSIGTAVISARLAGVEADGALSIAVR